MLTLHNYAFIGMEETEGVDYHYQIRTPYSSLILFYTGLFYSIYSISEPPREIIRWISGPLLRVFPH